MADRNEEVLDLVREELKKEPGISLQTLYERAQNLDSSMGGLSLRQFNGRYVLQAKRAAAGASKRRRTAGSAKRVARQSREARAQTKGTGEPRSNRDAIRGVFMEFAHAATQAETRAEIVDVLTSVDTYIERIEKLSAGT